MIDQPPHVATVVVTFNRLRLLESCLTSILHQSRHSDSLIIVDNASNDGTVEWLKEWLPLHAPHAVPVYMEENTGGAGGFCEGLRVALERGADWIWMMDDDAEPLSNALEELLDLSPEPGNLYGSLAVNGDDTSWVTTLVDENSRMVNKWVDVPVRARVQSLPFLGFMVHRSMVEAIGLPDKGYFIAADDIEYCMRAQAAGADIIIAGKSRIVHPKSDRYLAKLPFRQLVCLRLSPWKRYYDTRNRLLIARKYYGIRMLTQTIPGSFVRYFAAMRYEADRLAQSRAFFAGLVDGVLGKKGRRHESWGIKV